MRHLVDSAVTGGLVFNLESGYNHDGCALLATRSSYKFGIYTLSILIRLICSIKIIIKSRISSCLVLPHQMI
jgi:hypothetical protein